MAPLTPNLAWQAYNLSLEAGYDPHDPHEPRDWPLVNSSNNETTPTRPAAPPSLSSPTEWTTSPRQHHGHQSQDSGARSSSTTAAAMTPTTTVIQDLVGSFVDGNNLALPAEPFDPSTPARMTATTTIDELVGSSVDNIATFIRQQYVNALQKACWQLSQTEGRASLDKEPYTTKIDGLAKLVALTAIPHISKTLQKVFLCVSGPRAQNDIANSSLHTRPESLGWQAKLTVRWVDLGEDRTSMEQMAEIALAQILKNLKAVNARLNVLIAYDQGWEQSRSVIHVGELQERNCDIMVSALILAWAKTGCLVRSLEVYGDAGCDSLATELPSSQDTTSPFASLRTLDLDLHQRDKSGALPEKLFKLLEACRNIETLKLRSSPSPAKMEIDVLGPLKNSITRSHAICSIMLHGISGSATEFIEAIQRTKFTLRKQRLYRVELCNATLTEQEGSGSWADVLEFLRTSFELNELILSYLCGQEAGVWTLDGEVDFAAEGRDEVAGCLQQLVEEGRSANFRAREKGRKRG